MGDPFATPEHARSPVRRLRGRLPAAVTLWTAYPTGGQPRDPDSDGARRPEGLTVSSTVVVDGEPGRLLGVLDEESTLWAAVRQSGRFAVAPLRKSDGQLADMFAGLMPAPGGAFAARSWRATEYGPVLAELATWAGCRLDAARPMGWGLLVEATIEVVQIGPESPPPLIHLRGRYRGIDAGVDADRGGGV